MRMVSTRMVCLILVCALAGCGGMSNEDRLKILVPNAQTTIPVRGKVLVDGKPVKDLWVKLHPVESAPKPKGEPKSLVPKGQTGADGSYQITSYIGGDGAPRGDYKITVEWLTYQQLGNRWTGPSKLDGVCGDPKTTEFEVTVADAAVTVPTLEVSAKPESAAGGPNLLQPQKPKPGK